jgi:hypothetical protein
MRRMPFVSLVLVLLALLSGCSKKDSTTQPAADPSGAAALVNQANTKLGQIIAGQVNAPQTPSDIDFSEPYGLYQQALAKDGNNLDARFGEAFLGMTMLTVDTEVNAAFAEWANYLSSRSPFEVPATPGPLGVPAHLGRGRDVLHLPFEKFVVSQVALTRSVLGAQDPQIRRIQDILEQRALPRLATTLADLQILANNPGWTFVVTPQMQGDPAADPIEIDRTDILAFRAGCGLLASMLDEAVAYNLNFAAYDSSGLVNAFSPGSDWLKFRTNGAARLSDARLSILGAVDDAESSLNSLLAENDPQDDDLIKSDPNFNTADQESLRTYFGHVRTAMNGGFQLMGDWDRNTSTPKTLLEIHPAALFNNAPPDWKAMLPGYTAQAVRLPAEMSQQYVYDTKLEGISIPTDGYYSAGVSHSVSPGYDYSYEYGGPELLPRLHQMMDSLQTRVASLPEWAGDFSGSVSYSDYFSAGNQTATVYLYYNYSVAVSHVYAPQITWNANTFGQWTWPDPTFRGLLPGITTTSQLMTLWGIDAGNWQKTMVLGGANGGYGPAPNRMAKR